MEIQEHLNTQEASWYAEYLMGKVSGEKLLADHLACHLEVCQKCREHVIEIYDIGKSVQGLLEMERGVNEMLLRPRVNFWYRLVYYMQRMRAKAGFWSF